MNSSIAILGGTGAEGQGLARRFVQAGHAVILGSRQAERAATAARELGSELVSGLDNRAAASSADLVILTLPYAGMIDTLTPLVSDLSGKTVITAIVPLEFVGGVPRIVAVPAGSAAQELQAALPESRVVGAFHHLSAPTLSDLSHSIDADVLVCGDDAEARRSVIALAELLPGVRGIDAGPLESAAYIEGFTALLLRINRRYKVHAGLRITDLPESLP